MKKYPGKMLVKCGKKINTHFFENSLPSNVGRDIPSVFVIILDSTSRAAWHRSMPKTTSLLREDNQGYRVFEFLRYSSVAWGTANNMAALLTGPAGVNSSVRGNIEI